MTVRELIEILNGHDQDAEVHYPSTDGWNSNEICEVYTSTATYGVMTPNPKTVKTVVLATGTEGL